MITIGTRISGVFKGLVLYQTLSQPLKNFDYP